MNDDVFAMLDLSQLPLPVKLALCYMVGIALGYYMGKAIGRIEGTERTLDDLGAIRAILLPGGRLVIDGGGPVIMPTQPPTIVS